MSNVKDFDFIQHLEKIKIHAMQDIFDNMLKEFESSNLPLTESACKIINDQIIETVKYVFKETIILSEEKSDNKCTYLFTYKGKEVMEYVTQKQERE